MSQSYINQCKTTFVNVKLIAYELRKFVFFCFIDHQYSFITKTRSLPWRKSRWGWITNIQFQYLGYAHRFRSTREFWMPSVIKVWVSFLVFDILVVSILHSQQDLPSSPFFKMYIYVTKEFKLQMTGNEKYIFTRA